MTGNNVAGIRTQKSLGRFVKRGEKGILIFGPMIGRKKSDGAAEPTVDAKASGLPFSSWRLRRTATIPFALVAGAGAHICGERTGRTRLPIVNHRRFS